MDNEEAAIVSEPKIELSSVDLVESTVMAEELVHLLDQKKGEDIRLINLKGRVYFTDFFIIATGTSDRHVRSLAEEVDYYAHVHKIPVIGSDGWESADWILIDLGDVIVHVFQETVREFYNLEKLWSDPQAVLPTTWPFRSPSP